MLEDFFSTHGPRAQRGDLEPIILNLLHEKPMHGYEIIRTLEERSHGFWRPSPGSVYPILQFLEEQDLVVSSEQNGKKTYTITTQGKERTEACPRNDQSFPFKDHLKAGIRFRDMRELARNSFILMKKIVVNGSDADLKAVKEILNETHDKLKKLVDSLESDSKE